LPADGFWERGAGNDPAAHAPDLVVGCISALSLEQITPWLSSLDACGFQGRKIVIHFSADADVLAELTRRGCEALDARALHQGESTRLKSAPLPEEISVDRFYYLWYFLGRLAEQGARFRYVVATDVRDVIFQRDPIRWLEKHLGGKRLLVSSEALRFEDEPWGARTMLDCFGPNVWERFRRRPIYNAGTIAGELRTIVDLALQVYTLAPGERVTYSDQAALNLLLGQTPLADVTRFACSEDGWACQAGTMADPNLLPMVRHRLLEPEPWFDGDVVRTAAGEAFTLVHQWDRVPEWAGPLRLKYSR
jgi:hypothetical protein